MLQNLWSWIFRAWSWRIFLSVFSITYFDFFSNIKCTVFNIGQEHFFVIDFSHMWGKVSELVKVVTHRECVCVCVSVWVCEYALFYLGIRPFSPAPHTHFLFHIWSQRSPSACHMPTFTLCKMWQWWQIVAKIVGKSENFTAKSRIWSKRREPNKLTFLHS